MCKYIRIENVKDLAGSNSNVFVIVVFCIIATVN